MSDTVISVQNLGKKYRIRHQAEGRRYTALRDVIAQKCAAPFRWLKKSPLRADRGEGQGEVFDVSSNHQSEIVNPKSTEDFWALKDVSFEVKQGEVVGIIGRNGAGKSTLLKILSRITEPTEGRVEIEGRVASLLEVGTGFHPELTGRENIFLNGAILGMHRAEIKKKFDEIVAFAEVEKFLDTPVKRYSSGMYVRLAFAVAAHLEPEILIVDEVLAVGDVEFQKKCLGKIKDVATKEGRTVLFVSHNLGAIRNLCEKGICLVDGKIKSNGETKSVIDAYLATTSRRYNPRIVSQHSLELTEFKLCRAGFLEPLDSAVFGEDYELRFQFSGNTDGLRLGPMLQIFDNSGTLVSSICGVEEGIDFFSINGRDEWVVSLPKLQLLPGRYTISFQMFGKEPQAYFEIQEAFVFHVESALLAGASRAYRPDHGIVRICAGLTVNRIK